MSELKNLLVVRSGPIAGSSYVIENNETYLGRDLANDLPVPDPEISRRHARFLRKEAGVYLEDLGSTNGTFVNGVRLTAAQLLRSGDLVTLAENTVMSFEVREETTQPTPVAPRTYEPGLYEPEPVFKAEAPRQDSFTPVPQPIPQQPIPTVPEPIYREKKKAGWCLIVLIILLIVAVIVGLILLFMPATWWCAITFNQLPGCPIY